MDEPGAPQTWGGQAVSRADIEEMGPGHRQAGTPERFRDMNVAQAKALGLGLRH